MTAIATKESREVATQIEQPSGESTALMGIIEKASLDPNFDVEKLSKLLEVKERWEANEARKLFVAAKTAFRAEAITVNKDGQVGFDTKDGSTTEYKYATLGNVADTIGPALAKHGLSYSWETGQNTDTGAISVTCTLTHEAGHSESTTLSAGLDTSGKKNHIQAIGSTVSYLERYTLLAATGTATAEQDDDADAVVSMIDDDQKQKLVDLMKEVNADTEKFLAYYGIEFLDKLPASKFNNAKRALEEKREIQEKRKAANK